MFLFHINHLDGVPFQIFKKFFFYFVTTNRFQTITCDFEHEIPCERDDPREANAASCRTRYAKDC